jgi:hypothetical protein
MITKQQLENAALAMGLEIVQWAGRPKLLFVKTKNGAVFSFNPPSPTTQGKADLQDLMLALPGRIIVEWEDDSVFIASGYSLDDATNYFDASVPIINGNKHAALAEAVVSVASQIWEGKQ